MSLIAFFCGLFPTHCTFSQKKVVPLVRPARTAPNPSAFPFWLLLLAQLFDSERTGLPLELGRGAGQHACSNRGNRMSNRNPDGSSKEIDYASLGEAQVRALLDSGHPGWTTHQAFLARKWLASLVIVGNAETADIGRKSLRVMWIAVWIGLATLFATYLIWKASN
jgi:hypothetical protein